MRNRTLERIKMAIIVVLFMSTILLLYLLWTPEGGVGIFDLINRGGRSAALPEAKELMQAGFAVRSGGNGDAERSEDPDGDVRSAAMEELSAFLSQSYVEISAVSAEQYGQAMEQWPSVRISYLAEIPFSAFCSMCNPDSTLAIREDVMMKTLAFSDAAPDSVFVTDGAGNIQRFIFGEARESVDRLRELFGEDTVPCYKSGELLGFGDALLPLGGESGLRQLSAESETDGDDLGIAAARYIFGDTFSFVRRMVDSFGNITYMYGYGDRNLYLYTDGSLAFSTSDEGALQTSFAEDLDTALRFAAGCGGLDDDEWEGLMLSGYSESGGRVKTRTFAFSQNAAGRAVYLNEGGGLVVTVTGGSVTAMSRAGLSYTERGNATFRAVISPANVIANNSHHIYNVLHGSVLAAASDEAFEYAARAAEDLSVGYYARRSSGSRNADLLPCWVLRAGGVSFYFDLYTGTPLGYTR